LLSGREAKILASNCFSFTSSRARSFWSPCIAYLLYAQAERPKPSAGPAVADYVALVLPRLRAPGGAAPLRLQERRALARAATRVTPSLVAEVGHAPPRGHIDHATRDGGCGDRLPGKWHSLFPRTRAGG
jgi:hypothetical protein